MKAIVCMKQTPSTTAVFRVEDGEAKWDDPGGKPLVLNPWDEYAVEECIRLKENHGASDAIVLTMGDESALEQLKFCYAMGCNEAILVSDEAFVGSDTLGTARVLAAAIKKSEARIAIFGKRAIDGDTGQTTVQVAVKLGWTPLTFVSAIKEVSDDKITVERLVEDGKETVTANLPVVINVVKEINEPRYPSFMGIRKANRAKIPTWTEADLAIEGSTGTSASKVDWSHIYELPAKEVELHLIEAGTPEERAQLLADKLFEEKVI